MTDEPKGAPTGDELKIAAVAALDPNMGDRRDPQADYATEADDAWLMENQGDALNEDDEGWVEPVEEGEEQPEAEHTAPVEEEEGEATAEHTTETEPTVTDDAELQRAKSALARDGVPASVLDGMADDEVRSWGLKRDGAQKDTDRAYGELKEAKSKLETPSTESPGNSEHTEPTPGIDLAATLKPLVDDLALDDPAKEALAKGIQAAVDAALGPIKDQNTQMREQVSKVAQTHAEAQMDKARQTLGERFPGVSDQAKWDGVLARADGLAKSGAYSDPVACLTDACKIEMYGSETPAPAPADKETRQKRALGKPTTTSRREAPARALSESKRQDMYLKVYDEKGPAAAKAAYGG